VPDEAGGSFGRGAGRLSVRLRRSRITLMGGFPAGRKDWEGPGPEDLEETMAGAGGPLNPRKGKNRFELAFYLAEWFLPAHWFRIRRILKWLCRRNPGFQLLDVGGRKSTYTTNLRCDVHLVDLPRESEIQEWLKLGLTDALIDQIRARQSNIRSIRLEDITRTTHADATFDGVAAVEVIEHVPDDSAFVSQVWRVLKAGGSLVLTTPNGLTKPCTNPDHIRHYTGPELEAKLRERFQDVRVFYGVRRGYLHRTRRKGWYRPTGPIGYLRAPWVMLCCLVGNLLEMWCPVPPDRANQLFAVATKQAATGESLQEEPGSEEGRC